MRPNRRFIWCLSAVLLIGGLWLAQAVFVGCDPTCRLRHAVEYGNAAAAEKAIGDGADVNYKMPLNIGKKVSLAHLAAYRGHDRVLDVLIRAGADLSAVDANGKSVLMEPIRSVATQGSLRCIRLLLDKGSDVNHRDEYGVTALQVAAQFADLEIVKMLLNAGADVNASERGGHTPLHRAVMRSKGTGEHEVVKLLLASGADPNISNKNSETPEMLARKLGKEELASLIARNGEGAAATKPVD
jgi:ankyrin repeat protein